MNDVPRKWWSRPWVAAALLAAVLVLAAALRLKGIAWGLPYSFINADESTVMPIAIRVARGHVDPGFFYYPSFFFYLVAAATLVATPALWLFKHGDPLAIRAFVIDPGPYFLIGRVVSAAFGVAAVYFVYGIGRAAFGRPAGLIVGLLLAVAPLAVTYSHVAVTDMTATALALLAIWLLLEAAQGRGRRWLVCGAVAAGLATSTKYNLGALVLPATVAAVYASREEVARRAAAGARAARVWARLLVLRVYVPMVLAFVAGSPFVVLDPLRFGGDFLRQNQIVGRGWLGFENVGNGFWYNLHTNLGGGIGIVLVVLGVAGVAWALWRRTRLDLMVAPYVVLYYLYISTWKELADRYLLPIAPLVILFAVRFCLELAGLRPSWRRVALPVVAAVLAVAFALPLASAMSFDRGLVGTDTRALAKDWVERTIPGGTVIATENYGPQLVESEDRPYFTAAGLAQPAYRIVRIPVPLPGEGGQGLSVPDLQHEGVRYVVLSSAMEDRVRAAASTYPARMAFYRDLERTGKIVKEFRPGPGERGPVLKIYRMPPAPH